MLLDLLPAATLFLILPMHMPSLSLARLALACKPPRWFEAKAARRLHRLEAPPNRQAAASR